MSDKELLKVAAMAIAEHAAWVARNEARSALRRKLKEADVDRFPLTESDWAPEEWAEWQALLGAASKAQAKLGVRRVATRRAITRGAICAEPETKAQAVPDGFDWPKPPARNGQSHVLFDDGYAEGWAKAISVVQAMLAAAPQPPAPASDDVRELRKWLNEEPIRPLDRAALARVLHAVGQPPAPSEQRKPLTWQPIESAPKNGRTLLLGYPNRAGNWRTVRGQWMSQDYIDSNWEDPDSGEPGWFETSVEADEVPNCWPINPTHWMLTPEAPDGIRSTGGEHE